jgi:hypothetical protein
VLLDIVKRRSIRPRPPLVLNRGRESTVADRAVCRKDP